MLDAPQPKLLNMVWWGQVAQANSMATVQFIRAGANRQNLVHSMQIEQL